MEPFAARAAAAVLRPASAPNSEASTILRDGRILAAEVLSAPNDGTLLLALGRHRVPAESNIQLDPGQTFLVRVDGDGEDAILRMLRPGDPEVAQLLAALRRVVGEDRPIGELLQLLAARIAAEAAQPGGVLEELADLRRAIANSAFDPGKGASGLFELLAKAGGRYEALLSELARGRVGRDALDALRANLKAELLAVHRELEDGPLRELVSRALTALEAEQLLNVARRNAGEALVWSFPFPDAGAWATAHLFVEPREREAKGGGGGDEHATVSLALDLSRIGAVRADLTLAPDMLYVRMLVAHGDVARRVQADFPVLVDRLVDRLGDGKRTVHLFVRVASREEVARDANPLDIRFLRDHHLMDVEG